MESEVFFDVLRQVPVYRAVFKVVSLTEAEEIDPRYADYYPVNAEVGDIVFYCFQRHCFRLTKNNAVAQNVKIENTEFHTYADCSVKF